MICRGPKAPGNHEKQNMANAAAHCLQRYLILSQSWFSQELQRAHARSYAATTETQKCKRIQQVTSLSDSVTLKFISFNHFNHAGSVNVAKVSLGPALASL